MRRGGEIACGSDGCGAAAMGLLAAVMACGAVAMGAGNPISCKTERCQDLQEGLRCERRNLGICQKKTSETKTFFLAKV